MIDCQANRDWNSPFSAAESSRARSEWYRFVAEVIRSGWQDSTLEVFEAIHGFDLATTKAKSPDELASEHYVVFLDQLPPCGGLFLDNEGLVGGETANAILDFANQIGIPLETNEFSADHLVSILQLLAFLSSRQADYLTSDENLHSETKALQQQLMVERFLIPWLHSYLIAFRQLESNSYLELISLLVHSIEQHWSESLVGLDSSDDSFVESAEESKQKFSLATVADFSRFLTIASRCGLFLTRHQLVGWGRQLSLSLGFGSRKQMLETLYQGAIKFEKEDELKKLIVEQVDQHRAELDSKVKSWPALANRIGAQLERLSQTRKTVIEFDWTDISVPDEQ